MNNSSAVKFSNPNILSDGEFIFNDAKKGKKVFSVISEELKYCDEFWFSVAFITDSGIEPFLGIFRELEQKGVSGKILTSDYLDFTEPKALDKIAQLENIELRMFKSSVSDAPGFHSKGYIFEKRRDGTFKILIGSSNLTASALNKNIEWNTLVERDANDEFCQEVLAEFYRNWNSSCPYSDFIDGYRERYKVKSRIWKKIRTEQVVSIESARLTPNAMQTDFIQNLKSLIDAGENKALLISATGTGKTYASAFALAELGYDRALYIVHREQIARRSMESFKNVLPGRIKMGILSGNSKDLTADYVFSTMQTLSRPNVLESLDPERFDVIVIDESHRVGADSYRKILDHFRPKFLLGMTATPERSDGYDIYTDFDHNIACEIRLKTALEEDMLCPFNYFGVTDIVLENENGQDGKGLKNNEISFDRLVTDRRIDFVIEQIEFYGYSGKRVKGLVFCSRLEEAQTFSAEFNRRGYKTVSLSGSDSQEKRMEAVERLSSDDIPADDQLDYIFSVDVFNEGIDIPEINQVVFLRPTQSPIIFVQQLGRGLRKAKGKEYVVILDFIANYRTNYMIPVALYGDNTYQKERIRKNLASGGNLLPGASTIYFDKIARDKIFKNIDSVTFGKRFVQERYTSLKNKLGRIPLLKEFDLHDEIDVHLIFENYGSYYGFLENFEQDFDLKLSKEAALILVMISTFVDGRRPHELLFMEILMNRYLHPDTVESDLFGSFREALKKEYDSDLTEKCEEFLISLFTGDYWVSSDAKKFRDVKRLIERSENGYVISDTLNAVFAEPGFTDCLRENIEACKHLYDRYYRECLRIGDLVVGKNYSYFDVFRLLNWKKQEVALNVGGYKYNEDTATLPIFVNYHKDKDVPDSQNYNDYFIDCTTFKHISKSKRTLESEDVRSIIDSDARGISLELFVRKNRDSEFFYLGPVHYSTGSAEQFQMKNAEYSAVAFRYTLEYPAAPDLYNYLIDDTVPETEQE